MEDIAVESARGARIRDQFRFRQLSRLAVAKNGRRRMPSFQILHSPLAHPKTMLPDAKSVATTQLIIFAAHAPPMGPPVEKPFIYVRQASMPGSHCYDLHLNDVLAGGA